MSKELETVENEREGTYSDKDPRIKHSETEPRLFICLSSAANI